MGNLRVSNEVILAKIESVYGTDPAPSAGSNAVLVQNVSAGPVGLRMNDRPAVRANIGKLKQVFGGKLYHLAFDVEIKGSGAAGTAPEHGVLLRACGMGETVVASTSVTYKPISTSHESITLWWYEGGRKLHKLNGAVGMASMKLSAGGLALYSFDFFGHHVDPTDASQPAPTYGSQVPKPALSMAISLGGVTGIIVREWSLGLNNVIAQPPSIAAADGYGQIQITGRDVAGEITMDAELASVIDVDAQHSAGTGITFLSGTLGSVAGNRVAVTGATNGLYWRDRNHGEGEGQRIRTMPFGIEESSTGNDEIAIAYT
jgi:hypothetical protein